MIILMPQTASESKVNGMFLASHSPFWRSMESRQRRRDPYKLQFLSDVEAGGMLTGQDVSLAVPSQAAEVRLAILLVVAHACRVIGARPTCEAAEEAFILTGIQVSVTIASFVFPGRSPKVIRSRRSWKPKQSSEESTHIALRIAVQLVEINRGHQAGAQEPQERQGESQSRHNGGEKRRTRMNDENE